MQSRTVRRLAPDEKALWRKVIASVRPLDPRQDEESMTAEPDPVPQPVPAAARKPPAAAKASPAPAKAKPGTTLDGTWDRRLSRGIVQPDVTVDLHGHNLGTAYTLLDARLDQAIAMGARVLLLVTGKAPREDERPVKRGAIRAAVGDWLAASRHARNIAAVRGAHPRHGGAGALYIVLRRQK